MSHTIYSYIVKVLQSHHSNRSYCQIVHNYSNIAAIITDINVSHELKNCFSEAATTEKKVEKKDMCAASTREEIHIILFTCEPLLNLANREAALLERTIGWYWGKLYVKKQHTYAPLDSQPFIISPHYIPGTTLSDLSFLK